MIYWITGQPCEDKTKLVEVLFNFLQLRKGRSTFPYLRKASFPYTKSSISVSKQTFLLDKNNPMDLALNPDCSKHLRFNSIVDAQKIALYLHNEDMDVVVDLVSPYREQRQIFKDLHKGYVKEIYVHNSKPTDTHSFKVIDFEPPLESFLDIDTTYDSSTESLEKIIQFIFK